MHVDMHRGLELGKGIIKTVAISRPNILEACPKTPGSVLIVQL